MANSPQQHKPGSLRILLAPSAYYPHVGGIEELTRQLARALRARGHDVAVLTNRWPEGVRPHEILEGVSVTRIAFPLPAARPSAAVRFVVTSPRAAAALLRHTRRWRPDVIHVVGAGPQSAYVALVGPCLSARVIFTAAGEFTFDANGIFERSLTLRTGLRGILRRAAAVTAPSEYVMRDLMGLEAVRGLARVIPNGVDPEEFAISAIDDSELPAFAPYVLAVGRLVPQKGFDVLLDAFRSDLLTGLNLVFAGEGFLRQRLEERADDLGLGPRVRFLGSVDRSRLARLLKGAHAFAFPSRGEAFGIALLEAMAAGVPAVAAAAGGIPELVRDGKNALLVAPDDPQALAAAIGRITTDMQLREHLVRGGRETAAQLAWDRVASCYENVYLAALANGDN